MKIIVLCLLVVHVSASAQKTEEYYDYFWKPTPPQNARYYSITEQTDSGWLRKNYFVTSGQLHMQALFEDKSCKVQHGHSYYFYANGQVSSTGRKMHGKEEGICVSYHPNGMMADSALFSGGRVVDKRFRWYRNGYPSDSISRVNDSTYVHVRWFDDGQLASAGRMVNGKEEGKWNYYHHNGQVSSSEVYSNGKLTSVEYFDEKGNLLTDTSSVNREAILKGGETAWKKYLSKNLYWPSGLHFTATAEVTVGIDFVIDENGKVIHAEVSMPFHPEFDKIALKIIRNSPDWLPGIAHNRRVKAYRRQPITFSQGE